MKKKDAFFTSLISDVRAAYPAGQKLTLGEIVDVAEKLGVKMSDVIVADAMATHDMTYDEVIESVLEAFKFNLLGLEIGLNHGNSFLLGTIGHELEEKRKRGPAVIADRFIDKAVVYTLATEVGNHEVGLQPCAGTGDSCVYTGLLRALLETKRSRSEIGQLAALIIKIGLYFKEGKKTTGCNMEGYGAGAACTAAALTEMRKGTPRQVAKAIVLAMSPTIAVPCTPRVIVSGLCATHIGGAVLIGNLAANLALKTSIAVPIDVDVMIAMAANIHSTAAPVITKTNIDYMRPYFKTEGQVDGYIAANVLAAEQETARHVVENAREEVRKFAMSSNPLIYPFGDAVVGGSSIAVGSPTNMGRIAHELVRGDIKKVTIDLTTDLFARRAINVPGILMGAVLGATTKDIKAYHNVLKDITRRGISVEVRQVNEPEKQRIRVEASEQSAFVDAFNRGGGRLRLVDATPSLAEAQAAATRLGIKLAEV